MRLIDAERVRAEIFKASMDEHFMPIKLLDCDTVTEIIDNAPTIEERKGKWIAQKISNSWSDYKCSECGRILTVLYSFGEIPTISDVVNDYPFCHCGAKMEGAE